MCQLLLNRDEGLDDDVLDFTHEEVGVSVFFLESLEDFLEGPFVAGVIVHTFCHLEAIVILVDSVVSKMHEEIVELILVSIRWQWLVLVSGKPHDSISVQEDLERVTAEHHHVETQIKLQAINQVWLLHVLLHHHGVCL